MSENDDDVIAQAKLMADVAEALGDHDQASQIRKAIEKREGNKLDLDELARSLALDPDLLKGYTQAQKSRQDATATPNATSFTPSEQQGHMVASGRVPQREGETPSTATLLDEVEQLLRRFVVFTSEGQPIAAALFVLNTYAFDLWDYTPYLAISSATSESGKSRLLDVLETVVREPWLAIKPSDATLYRKIQDQHPTLLLDESDSLSDSNKQAIVAVLNSGFQRGRTVSRAMGEKGEKIEDYEVYCPKVFAGIGSTLSDTTASRTIPIRLRRKEKSDNVEKFRSKHISPLTGALRGNLEAWAPVAREALEAVEPECPEGLTDRQEDIWEPLFAIADMAGGDWPKRAREAATSLYDDARKQETASKGVLALRHIYEAFDKGGVTRLPTVTLLNLLASREDGSPWAKDWDSELRFGNTRKPANALALLLREFDIHPTDIKVDNRSCKGYHKEDFIDPWRRYGVLDDSPLLTLQETRPNATMRPSQVRGHETGRVLGQGRVSEATEHATWLFRCERCGHEQRDESTTRLPDASCYDGCGGKYRLVEEGA